jgi:cytochrome b
MTARRIKVWDAPVRLFHWSLVLLIPFSYISVRMEWMELHLFSGFTILTLLLFRVAWAVVGSDTARFTSFVKGPRQVLRYLASLGRVGSEPYTGHNPAGGWMVVLMLGLLFLQALTGLGANDDLLTEGPFAKYLGKHLSNRVSFVHGWNFDLLLAAMAMHILAIAYYAAIRRENLIYPMITGWRTMTAPTAPVRLARPALALALLTLCGLTVFGIAQL